TGSDYCSFSITYMTVHEPSFVGTEEPWDNCCMDTERRYRLGSEVASLSHSNSSEKYETLENLNRSFRLTSSIKCCLRVSKVVAMFSIVVLSSVKCPHCSLDGPRLTAMNVTDFRDNALLKLQVAGPFAGRVVDPTTQEFILIQVEQAEEPGQRRRRTQQVRVSME
ncbi:hypothetical protein GOODEAATRI_020277, partial [Goodea atripinnis]